VKSALDTLARHPVIALAAGWAVLEILGPRGGSSSAHAPVGGAGGAVGSGVAPGGRWALSPEAQAATYTGASVPYVGAGPWDPAACVSSITAHAARLEAAIRAAFDWVRTVGHTRCSANGIQLSIHAVGRALDVMTSDLAHGTDLANWLVTNARPLGVQLVIWNRSVWQGSLPSARRFAAYTGTNPHTDHVHVEVDS
jgi:hypothetical protein